MKRIGFILLSFRRILIWVALVLALTFPALARDRSIHKGPMVLAISWQPADCERAKRRPECWTQKIGCYDTSHFPYTVYGHNRAIAPIAMSMID
ncbi:MAG: hypothetical protein ACR2PF_05150 [Rhizobiaceae bacterium]